MPTDSATSLTLSGFHTSFGSAILSERMGIGGVEKMGAEGDVGSELSESNVEAPKSKCPQVIELGAITC